VHAHAVRRARWCGPKSCAVHGHSRRADKQIQACSGEPAWTCFRPTVSISPSRSLQHVDGGPGREYLGASRPPQVRRGQGDPVAGLRGAAGRGTVAIFESEGRGRTKESRPVHRPWSRYFNSLREPGRDATAGGRRWFGRAVRNRKTGTRGRLQGAAPVDCQSRDQCKVRAVELTSRESTYAFSRAKDLLGRHITPTSSTSTVALASNMISLAVDIRTLLLAAP